MENLNLIYKYIRGSHCHGINTPTSDTDIGGVFLLPNETLLGLGVDYHETKSNSTNDITYYELNKFIKLIGKSNPTILEALFIDDEFILHESKEIKYIKSYRDTFITKQCFNTFFGYAQAQIKKALSDKRCNSRPKYDGYDTKNMCETFRLLNMGIEIAQGKGVIVNRKNIDGEFLLDIKKNKYSFDYLYNLIEEKQKKFNMVCESSTLPDKINTNQLNQILIDIRTNNILI